MQQQFIYLNRVELQNGCLSLGHSNTFIPSILAESCINDETAKIDESKLRENLTLAISAYVSRLDRCPCKKFAKKEKRAKKKLKSEKWKTRVKSHLMSVPNVAAVAVDL